MTPPRRLASEPIGNNGTDILSARVSLQPFSSDDANEIFDALQDRNLTRWLVALPVPVDPASFENYLQFLQDPEVHTRILRVGRSFAGLVSLGSELSFWIKADFHGKGLGTQAVGEFLALLPTSVSTVTACCMLENKAATGLLTKLGFSQVGSSIKRFSFAQGHAVPLIRFELSLFPTTTQAF